MKFVSWLRESGGNPSDIQLNEIHNDITKTVESMEELNKIALSNERS